MMANFSIITLVPLDGEAGLAGAAAAPVDLPDERAILRAEGENVAHAGGDDDRVDDAHGNRLAVARGSGRKVGERPLPENPAAAGLEQQDRAGMADGDQRDAALRGGMALRQARRPSAKGR